MRVVFHEEDEAAAVAARLRSDGFQAAVVREWLAGEDDDEDHPWAVVTDAPSFAVELYAEEFDAWIDDEDDSTEIEQLGPQGLELPDAPRRVKGHFTG